jgi:hypothetical protein
MPKIKLGVYFLSVFLFLNNSVFAEDSQLGESARLEPLSTPLANPLIIVNPESSNISAGTKLLKDSVFLIDGSFGFKTYFEPSSSYLKNSFEGHFLNLLGRKQIKKDGIQLQNEYFIEASFDFFSASDSQTGHFLPVLRDAFLESENEDTSRFFRIGYFTSPMIKRERSFWNGYRLGLERSGLWEKYSYLKTTESGFEFGSLNPKQQWRFGFLNTDAEQAMPISQKDIFLLWEVLPQNQESYYGGINIQKGWYDGLPIKTNNMDRGFLWWGFRDIKGFQFTIEGFSALDAVDGIKKPIAEDADFTSKAGSLVRALGEALLIGYNFEWNSQKFRVDFKMDELDPDLDKGFNSVHSNTISITIPHELGQFSLSIDDLKLQKDHSIGNKARTTVSIDYLIQI